MENRPYILLRKHLQESMAEPVWPPGVRPALFDADLHVKQAHDLLAEAYRSGSGHVGLLDDWWSSLREDPEYDPSVFFLALDGNDCIIGLAQCWTSAFLKDLAVAETWRRQGVGEALLLQAFTAFQARGAACLDLKVEDANPSGAERLYRRMGMKPAG